MAAFEAYYLDPLRPDPNDKDMIALNAATRQALLNLAVSRTPAGRTLSWITPAGSKDTIWATWGSPLLGEWGSTVQDYLPE